MDGTLTLSPRAGRALALLLLLAAVLVGGHPATAEPAPDPSERWPSGGPAIQTAVAIAVDQWGMSPCHGEVEIGWWDELDRALDAQATWANDVGPYAAPLRNTSCEIALNPHGQWDWPKLCTVLVHEVGHLDGHDHADDRAVDDVMHASYVRPLDACAATPEPVQDPGSGAAPPPPPPTPASPRHGAPKQPSARTSAAAKARATRARARAKRRTAHARRAHARTRDGRRVGPRS